MIKIKAKWYISSHSHHDLSMIHKIIEPLSDYSPYALHKPNVIYFRLNLLLSYRQ